MKTALDFAELFETHYSRLYAYIRSKVNDRETAEDLTAATFERAFSRSQMFDPEKGSFTTWLFSIGRNLVINHYTTTSRKPAPYNLDEMAEIPAAHLSPEQVLLRQEQHLLLAEALPTLSERDQEIIQLKFFGRVSNRDIAQMLDLKEKTVSVIVLRALQKLKTRLERQDAS
ncbi:MAG TPA: sigma-70 family RNA polymerase sigma factor [Anaerolineae bacterium]|nr:sigma-70 family RNA polymerase sigma factor [Anaerolineae bacterium]